MSQVFEIKNEAHFNEEIEKQGKFLICFFATWCFPCQRFSPVITKLSLLEEFEDIFFIKVNIDSFPELAAKYKVSSVPSTVLISSDEKQSVVYGYKSEEEMKDTLKNFFN